MAIRDLVTGKRGELHVFEQLLKRDIVPYLPLIDLEGIDCIIRQAGGAYIELQVKTLNTPATPTWWQVTKVPRRANYYYALVSAPLDWATWIVPALVLLRHASGPSGPGRDIYDLDLASKGRETALQDYRENWALLTEPVVQAAP